MKPYQTMIKRIRDPLPERGLGKECITLTKLIQLRIPVEYPRRDELVEDADDEGRQDGEHNVIQ